MGRVVLGERRMADDRSGFQHTATVGDVIGRPAGLFIPAVGELIPDARLKREIRQQLDGVLEIPGTHETSPTQLTRRGYYLETADFALQKRRQAGETRLSQLARCGVVVILEALKPDAGADLMLPLQDLNAIGPGEEIAAGPGIRSIVRSG